MRVLTSDQYCSSSSRFKSAGETHCPLTLSGCSL